jgi:O-glycosyl hydrolase
VRCAAFRTPQGNMVAELTNSSRKETNIALESKGRSVEVSLPALSITTLLW